MRGIDSYVLSDADCTSEGYRERNDKFDNHPPINNSLKTKQKNYFVINGMFI